jgi:hypothetical protein
MRVLIQLTCDYRAELDDEYSRNEDKATADHDSQRFSR